MPGVTGDMQVLDQVVATLSGGGDLRERLKTVIPPLNKLKARGMYNVRRQTDLDSIHSRLTSIVLDQAEASDLQDLASDIAQLQTRTWRDAVWALQDKIGGEA